MELINRVRGLVEEELAGSEYFLVDVLGGGNSRKISVLVDGDEGMSIQACARISRNLSEIIDDESFESDAFILEISSPGADRPLSHPRQYNKHIGRDLIIRTLNGEEWLGKLEEVMDDNIRLVTPKGKKGKPGKSGKKDKNNEPRNVDGELVLSMNSIEQATVVISFK